MSITVLNTGAGLSATTLLNAESAQTVTGLKTYDRDPNPPFAVTASSAKVDNLDADKLDGQEGSYYQSLVNATNFATAALSASSYTPTFTAVTLGNGSVAGSYFQIGKLVLWNATLTLGSTSSVGAGPVTVTLPTGVTASSTTSPSAGAGGLAIDSSLTAYYSVNAIPNSTSVVTLTDNASAMSGISTSVPFAWANTDVLVVSGWYIAA